MAGPTLRDGAWRGEPALLLGGGASLAGCGSRPRAWAEAGRRNWHRVIVSGAGEVLYPDGAREDFWLSVDRPMWQPGYGYARVPATGQPARCPRVWVRPQGDPSLPPGLVDLELRRAGTDHEEGLSAGIAEGIYVAGNSGYAALNLVYHLGANPVYLLGYDGQPGEWHAPQDPDLPQHVYDRWMAGMLRLAARFAEVGRRVYWIGSGAAASTEEW